MTIKDNSNGTLTVPLDLVGCMVHFKHQLPTTEEIMSLKQYCLTQGDVAPWIPSSFSDQVADKFYQQVIDTENYNAILNDTMQPTNDAMDKVTQEMSFFDPSDSFKSTLKGKPACLLFNIDTIKEAMINHIAPVQEVYFPLYDVFRLKGQENFKNVDLQLGATECQIYDGISDFLGPM
jgi:hypothetical protein